MGCKQQFFKQSPACFAIYVHYLTETWGPSQQQWVWVCSVTNIWQLQCGLYACRWLLVLQNVQLGIKRRESITSWPEWAGKWCSMSTWWVQEPHPPKDLYQRQYKGKERGTKRSAWDRRKVQRKWVDECQSRMMHASVQRWLVLSMLVKLFKATVIEKRNTNFLRALQASSWRGS